MKHAILILSLAATLTSAGAQTPAPSPSSATHATSAAKPVAKATAPKPAVPAAKPGLPANPNVARYIKAPANIPVHKGIQKPVFTVALRYLEIKVGTGAAAEPGKLLKVHYTGYRAADGVKFDSSYDHPGPPIRDKDGKPVLGPDGKPKMGEPQSFPFHQGVGGTIPGFDQGFGGMKAGGKRRIFIPWQLAYGTRAIPDRGADHPGIPAMSDLIFDVELLDVADAPPPMQPRPPMGMMPGGRPNMQRPGAPGAPSAPDRYRAGSRRSTQSSSSRHASIAIGSGHVFVTWYPRQSVNASAAFGTADARAAAQGAASAVNAAGVQHAATGNTAATAIGSALYGVDQATPAGNSGVAAISWRVYCSRGLAHSATASPDSTSRPRSITAMRVDR